MMGPAGLWLPSMAWVSLGCCWHPQTRQCPPVPTAATPLLSLHGMGLAPGAGMGDR